MKTYIIRYWEREGIKYYYINEGNAQCYARSGNLITNPQVIEHVAIDAKYQSKYVLHNVVIKGESSLSEVKQFEPVEIISFDVIEVK